MWSTWPTMEGVVEDCCGGVSTKTRVHGGGGVDRDRLMKRCYKINQKIKKLPTKQKTQKNNNKHNKNNNKPNKNHNKHNKNHNNNILILESLESLELCKKVMVWESWEDDIILMIRRL